MRFGRSIVPGAALLVSTVLGIASSIASAHTCVFGRAKIDMKQARPQFSAIAVSLLAALFIVFAPLTVFSTDAFAQNPVPFINQPLLPDATAPGGPQFTLTVNGTGFVSDSVVNWNATALATQFVKGSQLTATVPAVDIATTSTASVTVANPVPGGGTSNVVFFTVAANGGEGVGFNLASSPRVGTFPNSVAAGDFNGDGKLDLAVANLDGNTVSILLGDGRGNFTLASSPAVGEGPFSLAVGDFNGDGKLDLATANAYGGLGNTLSILLGDGMGNFTLVSSPVVGEGPVQVAVGDFNGDGKLDLAVASDEATVSILIGDGTGNFTLASSPFTGGYPVALGVGDFNGDGKLDLAVVDGNSSSVTTLLGDGMGNFTTGSSLEVGVAPGAVAVGDFNGDGKLDLAVANFPDSVSILLGDGTGNFTLASSPAVGSAPQSVAVGDFNGDGNLDLAVANINSGTFSILLGDGTGNFALASSPNAGLQPNSVAVGDFNGDGKLDLATTNGEDGTVSVLLQVPIPAVRFSPSDLTFGAQLVSTTSGPQSVTLTNTGSAELNITAIAASGDYAQTDTCSSSLGVGATCTISVTFTPTQPGTRTGTITVTDNAPGSPQTISLTGTGLVSGPNVTLSPGSLAFPNQTIYTTSAAQTVTLENYGSAVLTVTAIAVTGDFAETNTCGNSVPSIGSCTISVTFTPTQTGSRTGSVTVTDNASDSPQAAALTGSGAGILKSSVPFINQALVPDAAAPGGQQFTLRVSGSGFGSNSVVSWNNFALATQYVSASQVTATVPASDIATAGTASVTAANSGGISSNVVFFPIATPISVVGFAGSELPTGREPITVVTADFNGDGRQDLAVTNFEDGTVSISLGNPDGTFQPRVDYAVGSELWSVVAGDFNGDGKQDLAVSGFGGGISILLGNGDGSFLAPVGYPSGSSFSGIVPLAVGDFNGDGKLDLIAGGTYPNTFDVLLGKGDGTFESPVGFGAGDNCLSQTATAGDFNNDGNLDVAFFCSPYTGPAIFLYLGNGDGTFSGGLAGGLPALGDPSAEGVAAAFGDWNGDGQLDAVVFDTYEHCGEAGAPGCTLLYFLPGDGNGGFGPPIQYETGFGFLDSETLPALAGDFNADAKLDLVAGGSLFLGNGDGSFQAPTPGPASGPYSNSAAAADFNGDGRLDLAAAVPYGNPGNTLVIQLQLPPGSPLLTLSSTSLNFGTQLDSTTSNPQYVFLFSGGNAPVTITNVTASGDFAQTNTCGSSVAAGANCTISVTFTPTAPGTRTGTITITDNAPRSPHVVSLTGTGTASPAVTLSTVTVSVGGQVVGTTSATQTVTLTNSGNAVLTITSIAITPAAFTETNKCGASLAAGASCTVTVTFTPSSPGQIIGMLTITDNASASPQQVILSGMGEDFTIGPYDLAHTMPAGLTASYDLQVAPEGGFNQAVSLACSGAPQQATCTVSPASVVLDGRNFAVITMQVSTTGPKSGGTAGGRWPAIPPSDRWFLALGAALLLGLLVLIGLLGPRSLLARCLWNARAQRVRPSVLALLGVLLMGVIGWAACGGGSPPIFVPPSGGTPAGHYSLTVTATSGNLTHSTTAQLTVQ